ncbi:efflux RND transporter periplasmic adaptor subunit [Plebeiibacterium marinum]|uniref:Efflux RND transporter periplasmic adaptor subunit n=1 Tax=Plebeiibacterium marinum TaxID=2992111 RepID=A0AAE3SL47_9BACT|nr:efflux RND transporter periplasmic adaptor subunit [Plebeiobacterium marinum]MCW3807054.1 efflux RND transporter periplasmic adaptor subunit [Plebeiobacterium marinum]
MKKMIRVSVYIASIGILCFLVYFQLKGNKEANKEIAELANITGKYYPVKALVIKPEQYKTSFETTGFLKSLTDLNLVAETNGRITNIYKRKGDNVTAGDVIAKVDDQLLQAQLNATKASYDQLEKEVKRFTKLANENAVTSQQLEEIKLNFETVKAQYIAAKKQLDDTNIKSPVSGYIENDFIEIGQFIGNGTVVCNIIDSKNLKLNIEIPESDYKKVELGKTVDIISSTYPDQNFTGKIIYIGKKAGYGNSFSTEIQISNNTHGLLKAGMFVTTKIDLLGDASDYFIPRKAIAGSLKDANIFIVKDNKAILTKVITGNVIDDQVQIVNGLKEGDTIVIEGNYNIYDKANVKVMNL